MGRQRRQQHYPSSSSSGVSQPKRRCHVCTIPIVLIVLLLIAVAGGILVWQLLPSDTRDSIRQGVGDAKDTAGDLRDAAPDVDLDNGPEISFLFDYCDTCCNGLPSLCNLPANEVLYASLHNANAAVENGFRFGANHDFSLERALDAGFRGVNMDIGRCSEEEEQPIRLLHGFCRLGTRDPVEVFSNIRRFLDEHPREVVIVPMEIVSEEDAVVTIEDVHGVLERGNITSLLYTHDPSASQWPTLQELIDMNKRVLFFHYNGPPCNGDCPPGLHKWFDFAAETEFSFEDVAAVDDKANSCGITRGNGGARDFFGLNVFVSSPLPSKTASETLNAKDYLQNHIEQCSRNNGLEPNLLFVDFWDQGDVVEVTQLYNQELVRARRRRSLRSRAERALSS